MRLFNSEYKTRDNMQLGQKKKKKKFRVGLRQKNQDVCHVTETVEDG